MMTEREKLETVLTLIRENKFDDAWEFLTSLLVTDPHLVAQWYLFSQFVTRGHEQFGTEVRGALKGVSRAAARAFDSILDGVRTHTPGTLMGAVTASDGLIVRLEAFMNIVHARTSAANLPSTPGAETPFADPAGETLVRFLERVRRERVLGLDPLQRIERRLDGLRRRLQTVPAPMPTATDRRLTERLAAFGNALGKSNDQLEG
ncbi:MAG: hypothetical protein HQL73_12025 [Magnetococcales bacterium]|nr:hypothetical protein [Magnetococcales bacterium]